MHQFNDSNNIMDLEIGLQILIVLHIRRDVTVTDDGGSLLESVVTFHPAVQYIHRRIKR